MAQIPVDFCRRKEGQPTLTPIGNGFYSCNDFVRERDNYQATNSSIKVTKDKSSGLCCSCPNGGCVNHS